MICLQAFSALVSVNSRSTGAQESDLTAYYSYPIALSVSYLSWQSLSSLNTGYQISDFSGTVEVPIKTLPFLRPFVSMGISRFDGLDSDFPDKWDHDRYYGLLGLDMASRIARNFEVGISGSAGVAEAVFPNIDPAGTVGSAYFLFDGRGIISLNPSYAFSIEFSPGLRWQKALSPLTLYDGFFFSLGFSLGFRFGEDPDSARTLIRSLQLTDTKLGPTYPAMRGYYAESGLGEVTIENTEKVSVTDVQVQFLQTGYMDSPTISAAIARIPPRGSVTVPIKAVFNDRIFSGEGARKVTGELILSYLRSGKPAEQRIPVTYELLDRRAISWDDDRKVAAFVTPQDSALKNFTAHLGRLFRDTVLPNWNQPMQVAMQTFAGLATLDLLYQEDASSPFTKVKGAAQAVDLVNAARETLARRYGDCDDLTVLFCSMLETRNVETGFITVPGHILPAFNTGVRASDYALVHPDRSMTIPVEGELWVPVEATLLSGKNGFLEAWKRGAEYWNANEGSRVFNSTRKAQLTFGPIPLEERDLGLQYGDAKRTFSLYDTALDEVGDLVMKSYMASAEKSGSKQDFNRLGILSASLNRMKEAEDAFSRSLKLDPKFLPANVNLGNLQFLRKEYSKAVSTYKSALAQSSGASSPKTSLTLLINLARTYSALGQPVLAKEAYGKAVGIDPERAKEFAYLGGADGSTSRATETASAGKISFTDEE